MPAKEELAALFVSPESGTLMAAVLLVALMIARYYVKKWLQSIEETRKAVFGSNETKGLKTKVNVLEEHRLEDRKDIDQTSAKVDLNHSQIIDRLTTLTNHVSSKAEETALLIGKILGLLEGKEKGKEEERNRRATDKKDES